MNYFDKYDDNERSRLGIKGELVFNDVIKESTISCVGSEKHEQ